MPTRISRLNEALEGRYRIERELGEGGMATVYLADDLKHERKVALKVLKPELAAVVGAERFLAEIKTTANLQHPHILGLYDSGEADGLLFYVMPYIEGESLRDLLDRERQLPVDDAVRIASNLAEALDYAHRRGVVHRDIKPANVLLQDGKPVISDFGIALAVSAGGGGRLTETGLSLGTPNYMSPEQATGDQPVGPAADIWALGCVLFEMLTGHVPHRGPSAQAVIAKILTDRAPSAREERPSVPANVDAVVEACLEPLPADRIPTGSRVAEALLDPGFRHGTSVEDDALLVTWRRRARIATGATTVLALVLIWLFFRAPWTTEQSPVYSEIIMSADEHGLASSLSQPLTISADGSQIVFTRSEDFPGQTAVRSLWIRRLDQSTAVGIPGTEGAGSHIQSPDGRSIVFSRLGGLYRIPVSGGTAEHLVDIRGFTGGEWHEDGTITYGTRDGLRRIPAGGGAPQLLTTTDGSPVVHWNPSVLPDGRGILFTEVGHETAPAGRIVVLSEDGKRTVLTAGRSGRIVGRRTLVFGRALQGGLWAVRLDPDLRRVEGEPVRVVASLQGSTAQWFSVSDDGTLVYLPGLGSETGVAWVDRGGVAQTLIRPDHPQLPADIRDIGVARLSPDGGRVAFRARTESEPHSRLFVYDIAREGITALNVGLNADWPEWTPDGQRVVFDRFDEQGHHDLYWMRADGSGEAEPFHPPNPEQQHAQWFSTDGAWLIIQHRPVVNGRPDLWMIPTSGDGRGRPLVEGPSTQHHAALSPDGRWMVYVDLESGQNEVYVTDFPDAERRFHISTERSYSPVWSPLGDEIFYRRWRDAAMMSVDVQADSVVRTGTPVMLFDGEAFDTGTAFGRSFDISPDGQRFLMIRRGEEHGIPRIALVQNWGQDLESRLGG